jgi:hypothetical protein
MEFGSVIFRFFYFYREHTKNVGCSVDHSQHFSRLGCNVRKVHKLILSFPISVRNNYFLINDSAAFILRKHFVATLNIKCSNNSCLQNSNILQKAIVLQRTVSLRQETLFGSSLECSKQCKNMFERSLQKLH